MTGAALALPVQDALLDGEVVALRDDGSSDFQLLQNSLKGTTGADLVYFVFDLLYLDGGNLIAQPLLTRKQALENLLKKARGGKQRDLIRYSDHSLGAGEALFRQACERSLKASSQSEGSAVPVGSKSRLA